MKVKRRTAVLITIVALAMAPNAGVAHSPPPVHYTGQQSTSTWRGISATIEVGSPDVVYDTSGGGFVAQRIMAKLADHSKWIEIGWVEYAAHQFGAPPTPKPEIYTYVKTGVEGTGGWAFHGQVTPGASVLFRIESSCGSVCTWIAKIYQAPTWVALRSYTFGTAAVNIEAYNEVDPGAPCKKHVVLATSPDAKVSWTNVTVKNSSDAWQYWSSGVSRSSTSDPYTSVWQNNYYKFTAERTGAATC